MSPAAALPPSGWSTPQGCSRRKGFSRPYPAPAESPQQHAAGVVRPTPPDELRRKFFLEIGHRLDRGVADHAKMNRDAVLAM